jgi:ABC-type amino acid transport substrate-binding protein
MPGWLLKMAIGVLLVAWMHPLAASDPPSVTFVTGYGQNTLLFRRFQLLYSDAFQRLGIHFKLISLPKDQALTSANLGIFDGDTSRVPELEGHADYVKLIRVDVIVNRSHHVAFTRNPRLRILNWDDIKAQNLRIAYPQGQFYASQQVKALQIPAAKVMTSPSCEELLKWVDSGRVDVYIDNLGNCWDTRHSGRYKTIRVAAILGEDINYPYVHNKHKGLVPRFTEALKASLDNPEVHAKLDHLEKESKAHQGAAIKVQLYTPYDFEPFILDRATEQGLIYDLQRYLNDFADGAYQFEVQSVPRIPVERLEKMRELAIVPFVAPSWLSDDKETLFDWTAPLLEDETLIVSPRKLALDSLQPEKLRGKTLCGSSTLRRDPSLQKILNEGLVKQTLVPDTAHCLQMLMYGRADFHVSGRMLLAYFMHKPELATQLYMSRSPIRHFSRRILITPKETQLLSWLNQKIEAFGKSSSWMNVLKAYHLLPDDSFSRSR